MSGWFERYGCDVVADGLVVGAVPRDGADVAVLAGLGVDAVVSLVADGEYGPGEREAASAAYAAVGITASGVPSEDFGGLAPAVLDGASDRVLAALEGGGTVYLHCRAGWQRSVVVAAAVLCRRSGATPEQSLDVVLAHRRGACPLPHQVEDLRRWWATGSG